MPSADTVQSLPPLVKGSQTATLRISISKLVWKSHVYLPLLIPKTRQLNVTQWLKSVPPPSVTLRWWGSDAVHVYNPLHLNLKESFVSDASPVFTVEFPILTGRRAFTSYLCDQGDLRINIVLGNDIVIGHCVIAQENLVSAVNSKPFNQFVNVQTKRGVLGQLHVVIACSSFKEPLETPSPKKSTIPIEQAVVLSEPVEIVAQLEKSIEISEMEMSSHVSILDEKPSKVENLNDIQEIIEILGKTSTDATVNDNVNISDILSRAENLMHAMDTCINENLEFSVAQEPVNDHFEVLSLYELSSDEESVVEKEPIVDNIAKFKNLKSLKATVLHLELADNIDSKNFSFSVAANHVSGKCATSLESSKNPKTNFNGQKVVLNKDFEFNLGFENELDIDYFSASKTSFQIVADPLKKTGRKVEKVSASGIILGTEILKSDQLRCILNVPCWTIGKVAKFFGIITVEFALLDSRFVEKEEITQEALYFSLNIGRLRSIITDSDSVSTISLSMRLISNSSIKSPPIICTESELDVYCNVNFNFTSPISDEFKKFSQFPLFIEVWCSKSTLESTETGLLGILRLPLQPLFTSSITGQLVLDAQEYPVVDLLSGMTRGWMICACTVGSLDHVKQWKQQPLVLECSQFEKIVPVEPVVEPATSEPVVLAISEPVVETEPAELVEEGVQTSPCNLSVQELLTETVKEPTVEATAEVEPEAPVKVPAETCIPDVHIQVVIHRVAGVLSLVEPQERNRLLLENKSLDTFVKFDPFNSASSSNDDEQIIVTEKVLNSTCPQFNHGVILTVDGQDSNLIDWIRVKGLAQGMVYADLNGYVPIGRFVVPLGSLLDRQQGIVKEWFRVESLVNGSNCSIQLSMSIQDAVEHGLASQVDWNFNEKYFYSMQLSVKIESRVDDLWFEFKIPTWHSECDSLLTESFKSPQCYDWTETVISEWNGTASSQLALNGIKLNLYSLDERIGYCQIPMWETLNRLVFQYKQFKRKRIKQIDVFSEFILDVVDPSNPVGRDLQVQVQLVMDLTRHSPVVNEPESADKIRISIEKSSFWHEQPRKVIVYYGQEQFNVEIDREWSVIVAQTVKTFSVKAIFRDSSSALAQVDLQVLNYLPEINGWYGLHAESGIVGEIFVHAKPLNSFAATDLSQIDDILGDIVTEATIESLPEYDQVEEYEPSFTMPDSPSPILMDLPREPSFRNDDKLEIEKLKSPTVEEPMKIPSPTVEEPESALDQLTIEELIEREEPTVNTDFSYSVDSSFSQKPPLLPSSGFLDWYKRWKQIKEQQQPAHQQLFRSTRDYSRDERDRIHRIFSSSTNK